MHIKILKEKSNTIGCNHFSMYRLKDMKQGVFYNDRIEHIFSEYFKEFSEKNRCLFSSNEIEKQIDELLDNKTIHLEFTRFLVRKIFLMVFSDGESDRLKEKFDGKMN